MIQPERSNESSTATHRGRSADRATTTLRVEPTIPPNSVGGLGIGHPTGALVRSGLRALFRTPRTRKQVLRDQTRSLRKLLRVASRVPYYGDLFEQHALDPDQQDPWPVLHKMPALARMDLRREAWQRLTVPGTSKRGLLHEQSSGSTGTQLHIWRNPFEAHILRLYQLRALRTAGVRSTDRIARLTGVFLETKQPLGVTELRQKLGVFRSESFNIMQPTEQLLRELADFEPSALIGYASVLHELARQLPGSDLRIRPRTVICGGEMLSRPMRRRIESAFHCAVVESYGAMELHSLAWQCPQSARLHVCDPTVILEILANGEPVAVGETGEVVCTGLLSHTFPLIRYRLGDLAVRGPTPCPCGAPYSTIEAIRGRTLEYYYTEDGSAVHHWTVSSHLFRAVSDRDFRVQIEQLAATHVVIRLCCDEGARFESSELETLRERAHSVFGREMRIDLQEVTEIPCAPSGKVVRSINRYRSPWLGNKWDPVTWEQWRPRDNA